MLVWFSSDKRKEIVTGFVGLKLWCSQSLANCIGFATDGASNMVGCNNSVWSRLKAVSPFCVQHKCICHSPAFCIQYAVSKLPPNIGFLLSEIPNWFGHSELRWETYKELFRMMNTATEFEPNWTGPLPFKKPSFMQWLVCGKVMFNILMN
jgi:hypothetical protein